MNFEEFKNEVVDHIKDFLPEKYADAEVKLTEIVKNNDNMLTGLNIISGDSNITPTIYLEGFFEKLENGADMRSVLTEIAEMRTAAERQQFDLSTITDFDQAKDNIFVKLVGIEGNEEYLKGKPHDVIEDLAAVYFIKLESYEHGQASVTISDDLMKDYGITKNELHDIAIANMDSCQTPTLTNMQDMMIEMMMEQMPPSMSREEAREAVEAMMPPMPEDGIPMFVLTNEDKMNGAAMLLSEGAMDMVRDTVGDEFFILPSSIHETLIVPKSENMQLSDLEKMVQEVNATQVAPQERLSDHVYEYDAEAKAIVRADKAAERRQEREAKPEQTEERMSFKKSLPGFKEEANRLAADRAAAMSERALAGAVKRDALA